MANISLLAVGSSSPEILLSIVESAITINQPAGQIGPACIIGSGTYNLFGIIAVCNIALPPGVIKKILHVEVFAWTTTWSIWAHLWLWIAYKKVTPGVIDIWEAFITLGMFPIFVFTTWLVDTRGWPWQWLNASKHVSFLTSSCPPSPFLSSPPSVPPSLPLSPSFPPSLSTLFLYTPLTVSSYFPLQAVVEIGDDGEPVFDDGAQFLNAPPALEDKDDEKDKNAATFPLNGRLNDIETPIVSSTDDPNNEIVVNNPTYAADPLLIPPLPPTNDRSASGRPLPMTATKRKSVLYYRHLAVQLTSGTGHHQVNAKSLLEARPIGDPAQGPMVRNEEVDEILTSLAQDKSTHIPKVLLKSSVLSVLESKGEARVQVLRLHGDKNATIHVKYTCKDDTALAGLDYQMAEGVLVMGPGEESKDIVVKILDDDMSEPDVHFEVQILSAEVVEGPKTEVKVLRRSTVITIVDDDDGGILMFELPTYEVGIGFIIV